jgi:hypothetical protein
MIRRPAGTRPALGPQDLVPALLVLARQVHALLRHFAADIRGQGGADKIPDLVTKCPEFRSLEPIPDVQLLPSQANSPRMISLNDFIPLG